MEAAVTIPNQWVPKEPGSSGGCLSNVVHMTWIFLASLPVFDAIFIAQGIDIREMTAED